MAEGADADDPVVGSDPIHAGARTGSTGIIFDPSQGTRRMQSCPECGAARLADESTCESCGADLDGERTATAGPPAGAGADFDQAAERKRFEVEYGVDVGDRTVDEYLAYVARQDYSRTAAFWLVVGGGLAWLGTMAYLVFGPGGRELLPAFGVLSVVLSAAVYADTARVGAFDRWAKVRWLYVLFPLVPLWGPAAAFVYLLLRGLKREETARARRRLVEAGIDLELASGRD